MNNELNMNKGFADYQERLDKKLNNNRKAIVEKFYEGLIKYNIDLSKMDKLIIERKAGIVFICNTIIAEKNGVREEIHFSIGASYFETQILREKSKREIIEEELKTTITYKSEGRFKMTETWEIDCTNIK